MPIKVGSSFLRNVSKSLGNSTVSAIGDLLPNVKNSAMQTKDYVSQTYRAGRDNLNGSSVKQTYAYKSTQELIGNAIKDLKSGNLYNKKRQQEKENESLKELGFDFDFDTDGSSNNNESGSVNNSQIVVNNIDTNATGELNLGISKLSNLNKASMVASQASSSIISHQLSSIVKFQHDNTAKFYTEMSEKITDLADNTRQITAFSNVMAEVSVGGTRHRNDRTMKEQLLGLSGIDPLGMVDLYKNKMRRSNGGLSKELFNMLVKPKIDSTVANPIGTLMTESLKFAMPKVMKSALGEFDEVFKNLPLMMQGKLSNWKDSNNPFKKLSSQIFGIDLSDANQLDFSNYEKGRVAFDGKTRRAITTVIPSLLSKILSQVSRNENYQKELVYNYETGKFTTVDKIRKSMDEEANSFSFDSYELKEYKNNILSANKDLFENVDQMSAIKKEIDKSFKNMVKNNLLVTDGTKDNEISSNPIVSKMIKDYFRNMSPRDRSNFQYEVMRSSKEYSDIFRRIETEESYHQAYDIDTRDPFEEERMSRLSEEDRQTFNRIKLFANGHAEKGIENNLNRKNPLYWLTEGIRKGNKKITDYFLGEEQSNPNKENKLFDNISSKMKEKEKYTQFAKNVMKSTASSMARNNNSNFIADDRSFSINPIVSKFINRKNADQVMNSKQSDVSELKESIINLNSNIEKSNKQRNSEIMNSSASISNDSNNESIKNLDFLPKINDNILHIISLMESKYSAEGLKIDRIGKFKDKISQFKDTSVSFFERFFGRRKRSPNARTFLTRTAGRLRGFFDQIFGSKDKKEKGSQNNNSSKGGGIFNNILNRLGGVKDIDFKSKLDPVFDFIKGVLGSSLDIIKKTLPKAKDLVLNVGKTAVGFGHSILNTLIGLGQKGANKLGDLKNNRKSSLLGGVSGIFQNILMGGLKLGGLASKGLGSLTGKVSLPSLDGLSRNKSKASSKGNNKISNVLTRLKGKNGKEASHVIVEGGFIDRIKEIVTVKTHVGNGNSAKEQLAEFEEARKNRNGLPSNKRGKDESRNDFYKRMMGQQGQGAVSGFLSSMAAEVAGEVIGNTISGNTGRGRRGGRLGRLGGGIKNGAGKLVGGAKGLLGKIPKFGRLGLGASALAGGAGAATAGTSALGSAGATSGASGLLGGAGKVLSGAARFGKFIPGVGLALTAGMGLMDGVNGFNNASQTFGTKDPTLGQKISSSVGSITSGLTFGLANKDSVSKGLYGLGGKVSSGFNKIKENPLKALAMASPFGLAASGMSKLFNKAKEDKDSPINKISGWVEKVGKFLTTGPAGMFFGGAVSAILGTPVGGFLAKVGNGFKNFFGNLFGKKDSDSSSGGSSSYNGKIGSGIGALAKKYESSGNAGTVVNARGDIGGQSFGMFQLARNTGSYKTFIDSLDSYGHKDWQKTLKSAYSSQSASKAAWQKIAKDNPKEFAKVQEKYFADKFFRPVAGKIKSVLGLDVGERSTAVQAALLSTSVQHGQGGALNVWKNALGKKASKMSDAEIINAVYNERGANNGMKYFPSSSPSIRASVVKRFKNEKQDALKMLKKDGGGKEESSDSKEDSNDKGSTAKVSDLKTDRSQFYNNPFENSRSFGTSSGDSRFSGGPSSSTSKVSFSSGSYAGSVLSKALGSGYADVSGKLSTSDLNMTDLRWKLDPTKVTKSSASNIAKVSSMSSLSNDSIKNFNAKSVVDNYVINSLGAIQQKVSENSATIQNGDDLKTKGENEEYSKMISILKEISNNGNTTNSKLTEVVNVLTVISQNITKKKESVSNVVQPTISNETKNIFNGM
ncbi:hypothetical protein Bp8pS_263 [Bacillus phage vB_BpuM-BpSp]|nr:hypothetical protein Bp8pS_263 [Bacillus phage vB_BpuM-BpSp]